MNDSTLIQLKILVERVVRPVRTSAIRKLDMRRELLTHVTAAFEEEAARLDSEEQALVQTAQRFGNTAELTGQFQSSIPKPDWGFWMEYLVGYPEGDPVLRRATRHFAIGLCIGLPLVPIFLIQGRMREWPIIFWLPMLCFLWTNVIHSLREALFMSAKRSWLAGICILVGSAIAMPATTYLLCLTISRNPFTSWTMIVPLLPTGVLLTPFALAVLAYATAVHLREIREWETLSLAD